MMFKNGMSLVGALIIDVVIVALGVGLYHWYTHRNAA